MEGNKTYMGKLYENSAKDISLGQAVDAYGQGIALEVSDGKDITIVIKKEPTSSPAK